MFSGDDTCSKPGQFSERKRGISSGDEADPELESTSKIDAHAYSRTPRTSRDDASFCGSEDSPSEPSSHSFDGSERTSSLIDDDDSDSNF